MLYEVENFILQFVNNLSVLQDVFGADLLLKGIRERHIPRDRNVPKKPGPPRGFCKGCPEITWGLQKYVGGHAPGHRGQIISNKSPLLTARPIIDYNNNCRRNAIRASM